MTRLIVALAALMVAGCDKGGSTEPSQQEVMLHDGLAFTSNVERNLGDIFFILTDGSALLQLTDTLLGNTCPSISPDGKQIAFIRLNTYYMMNADGTGARDLTPSLPYRQLSCPVWSPDGKKLAFTRNQSRVKEPGSSELYVVNADGSNPVRIAAGDTYGSVSWSPDGARLLFESHQYTDGGPYGFGINLINVDGTGLIRIPGSISGLAWSPSGDRIAFACGAQLFATRLCVAQANGTSGVAISPAGVNVSGPQWSPDGSRIAYVCGTSICAVSPDGTGFTILSTRSGVSSPLWSPTGSTIVYSCSVGTKRSLCAMNADGTGDRVLVSLVADNTTPSWAPAFP
jgi:TolB protein